MNAQLLDNAKSDRVRRLADLTRAKGRRKAGRFLIEGPQSVREAVRYRADAVSDIYVASDGQAGASDVLERIIQEALQADNVYVHRATREVMDHISTDAQGILAVGELDAMRAVQTRLALTQGSRIAAFWQVRDPGNAGTVIRAADAAGCDAVVFVDDCVDMFNPKVIRSTAGSLFHLPVLTVGTDEFFAMMGERGLGVWAADVYGTETRKPESLPDVLARLRANPTSDGNSYAMLFGNEARGLSADVLAQCQRIISIPLYGKAESLNLATSAAILLMSLTMASSVAS
ncbi:rRNA methyltransferase [Bifidobacterium sp. DSM 109963]|uniref:rRNA methyltransferase n=2 Tax=Bifidobacterium panos TaxID=2675321 RepID=A0ABX1SZ06_9BIFI|nr:rRNA methyltransferase [Bifidobacterium sp. DSM 109963]